MAVVNVKSTTVSNSEATPRIINSANLENGNLRGSQGLATITSGDSVGSTYRMFRVRSSDRMDRLLLWAPDIGTTTAADVGLYRTTEDGGAVVDADFFASAQALNAGPYNAIDITFEAGAAGGSIANAEKRIWEGLGLTKDPNLTYDVVMTLTGAADGTGQVLLRSQFVSGE